jgi:hypothetical protein
MRNHASHLTIAILSAAIGIACTGRNSSVGNARAEQGGGSRGVNQRMSLEGCVEAAPGGGNAWVLRNVAEVAPAQQPQGQERMEHAPIVPQGSWVRLVAGDDDLNKFLGKRVTIIGEVRDAGANTIGTAGQASPMPRAGEANGMPPQIAVERVQEKANGNALCGKELPGDSSRPTGR